MAKHPVPKRRASATRSKRRHSTWFTKTVKRLTNAAHTVICSQCKQPRLPHTTCPTCGNYRDRTVIDLASKEAKKIQKVKAD